MADTIQTALTGQGQSSGSTPVQYVETVEAYNQWAEVYDTDGNFLQALDTIEMIQLLPLFLTRVASSSSSTKLVDLGCGTGRNTLRLAQLAPPGTEVVGVDASPGMLEVARETIRKATERDKDEDEGFSGSISLDTFDLLRSPPAPPECALGAAGVISTLVLEHIPVTRFFEGAAALLAPGGYLLVTNMHSDMGAISQAGFVDTATGTKIRPTSYSHTVDEVVDAAQKAGFTVEQMEGERVRERMVDQDLAERLGKRAKKWVGITVWFGVCFRKNAV
ncbi:class I SAM-dependent DNA methyltransferase [Aspergillus affinis]|uniref:class I SAM-dependent DNA methyltransferase n=1 Tax=Aspergillus affinis TaxID=1070780 RepID=UPI0022FDFC66|nr:putative methyltransferase [Aspergillus affinis]KAI9038772.1 putative methyltransferase [Aspergillus affinis]